MPYIGSDPSNRFVAPKAASVFSGDGSTTAFTLDHAVGSDEDILVSVDGVIQEPSVAYAVSSGTTLTFTAAPSSNSGNNIFVYYLFRTVGTVSHPSNNALEATSGTFSGDVTIPDKIIHSGDTDTAIRFSDANEVKVETGGAENIKFATSNIVVNNGNTDMDFRIASDSKPSAFFLTGSDAKIIINGDDDTAQSSHMTLHFASASYSAYAARMSDNGSGAGFLVCRTSDNSTIGQVARNGTSAAVQFLTSSDYRLKENINYDFDATSKIKQLKPCKFTWKNDDSNVVFDGFLAHEVQEIVPYAINGKKDAVDEDGNIEAQSIDKGDLVPLLVKTIQELEARITALESK